MAVDVQARLDAVLGLIDNVGVIERDLERCANDRGDEEGAMCHEHAAVALEQLSIQARRIAREH